MVVTELRQACAWVAGRATHVGIDGSLIPQYAASLPDPPAASLTLLPEVPDRRAAAAFWLTLDAINFGSGWFPTLVKPEGLSGYRTISGALERHVEVHGPWSAVELADLGAPELGAVLGQDPEHPLMALYADSLNDLGMHLAAEHDGDPLALIAAAHGSAPALVEILAGWECFGDVSDYAGRRLPFLKRAQIAAADLARAGAARFADLDRLTMFADNLVPHVLRLDGILEVDPGLVARVEAGQLILHGSPEEVELRACALHAVELIRAAWPPARPGGGQAPPSAAQLDQLLWERGQGPDYKARPRHRSRCTAY